MVFASNGESASTGPEWSAPAFLRTGYQNRPLPRSRPAKVEASAVLSEPIFNLLPDDKRVIVACRGRLVALLPTEQVAGEVACRGDALCPAGDALAAFRTEPRSDRLIHVSHDLSSTVLAETESGIAEDLLYVAGDRKRCAFRLARNPMEHGPSLGVSEFEYCIVEDDKSALISTWRAAVQTGGHTPLRSGWCLADQHRRLLLFPGASIQPIPIPFAGRALSISEVGGEELAVVALLGREAQFDEIEKREPRLRIGHSGNQAVREHLEIEKRIAALRPSLVTITMDGAVRNTLSLPIRDLLPRHLTLTPFGEFFIAGRKSLCSASKTKVRWVWHSKVAAEERYITALNGGVLVFSGQTLTAIDGTNGKGLWQLDIKASATTRPVIDDRGNIVLGTATGLFRCVGAD